ncbi:uncharacterized protein G2W53_032867 [Senna tora]|uniref:Uncharacterized protein n=1 Tax=Senna tora TaxID=362788 RepID=A0A834SZZ0_9FABA|nr:uncharacterized protein G2W53_032867 [Senna tora]
MPLFCQLQLSQHPQSEDLNRHKYLLQKVVVKFHGIMSKGGGSECFLEHTKERIIPMSILLWKASSCEESQMCLMCETISGNCSLSSKEDVRLHGGLVDLKVGVELSDQHWVDWFFQIQKELPVVELEHLEAAESFSVEELEVYLSGWRVVSHFGICLKTKLGFITIKHPNPC